MDQGALTGPSPGAVIRLDDGNFPAGQIRCLGCPARPDLPINVSKTQHLEKTGMILFIIHVTKINYNADAVRRRPFSLLCDPVRSGALRDPSGVLLPSLFGQAGLFLGTHRLHAQAHLGHFFQLPRATFHRP